MKIYTYFIVNGGGRGINICKFKFKEITMKKKILTSVLIVSLAGSAFATKPTMHLQELQAKAKKENLKAGESNFIRPGVGYSTDKEMIVDNLCYAVKSVDKSGATSQLWLKEAYKFDDLKKELKVGAKMNIGIGIFGGGFSMSYLKAMQDTQLSYSLNFLSYATNSFAINIDRTNGKKGLSDDGDFLYDNGENPYFALSCGDDVITSYEKGAMLAFGLNLNFHNHSDLEKFKLSVHAGFGSIFDFSTSVEKFAQANHIDGTVSINAYQVGGEPEKLNSILTKDPKTGDYYALTCSMTNMTSCLKTASGLLDYASTNFPNQYTFSVDDDRTKAFGVEFASKENIRKSLLIKPPASFVTPEVEKARADLAEDLKKNEYYQSHLDAILTGYPVALDGDYRKQLQAIDDKATTNVDLLLDNRYGGIQCYTDPDTCLETSAKLESNLKPITDEEIDGVMKPIQNYYNTTISAVRWNNSLLYPIGANKCGYNPVGLITLNSCSITNNHLDINFRAWDNYPAKKKNHTYSFNATGTNAKYSGTTSWDGNRGANVTFTAKKSPYFFTPYQADESESK